MRRSYRGERCRRRRTKTQASASAKAMRMGLEKVSRDGDMVVSVCLCVWREEDEQGDS